MALPSFSTDTITIIRPTIKTERGTQFYDWDNAARIDVDGCNVQPMNTVLNQQERFAVDTTYTLLCPPETEIYFYDRVEYQGEQYTINGKPFLLKSPSGAVSHIKCTLEVWNG